MNFLGSTQPEVRPTTTQAWTNGGNMNCSRRLDNFQEASNDFYSSSKYNIVQLYSFGMSLIYPLTSSICTSLVIKKKSKHIFYFHHYLLFKTNNYIVTNYLLFLDSSGYASNDLNGSEEAEVWSTADQSSGSDLDNLATVAANCSYMDLMNVDTSFEGK